MLLIVSDNCEYVYDTKIESNNIIMATLQAEKLPIDTLETHIVWEACDTDLFHFSLIHKTDMIVINSKFNMVMNAIEECCMLETLRIVTSDVNYDTMVHELSIYRDHIPFSIELISNNVCSTPYNFKKGCISLGGHTTKEVGKYMCSMEVPYMSLPLNRRYSHNELRDIAEHIFLIEKKIIAVTAITNTNIFENPTLFKHDFVRAINISRILGAKYVIYGSSWSKLIKTYCKPILYNSMYKTKYDEFIRMMKSVCSYSKQFGIKIIIKPNRTSAFLNTRESVDNVIKDVRMGNLITGPVRDYKYIDSVFDEFTIYECVNIDMLRILEIKNKA
jgi:hypothetical protein